MSYSSKEGVFSFEKQKFVSAQEIPSVNNIKNLKMWSKIYLKI